MRILALALTVLLAACTDSPSVTGLEAGSSLNARRLIAKNYTAQLSGDDEVPANSSLSRGSAIFQLSPDGESISYRINVANIDDVLMAHIHLAPVGVNGGVVVWLYPDAPPPSLIPGSTSGTLAVGTITVDDLVGPLEEGALSDLLAAMNTGGAYVNVHTTEHVPGEIRGQIKAGG